MQLHPWNRDKFKHIPISEPRSNGSIKRSHAAKRQTGEVTLPNLTRHSSELIWRVHSPYTLMENVCSATNHCETGRRDAIITGRDASALTRIASDCWTYMFVSSRVSVSTHCNVTIHQSPLSNTFLLPASVLFDLRRTNSLQHQMLSQDSAKLMRATNAGCAGWLASHSPRIVGD